MPPLIATIVYCVGIAVLFFLNRDDSVRTSKWLWLPVIYIWILGSRPVSFWFGVAPASAGDIQLEGSPIDAAIFAALLLGSLPLLYRRRSAVVRILIASWPILVYFLFCLLSVLWSDFPGVALKRWLKSIGDLLMILVILTDREPLAALGRFFSRAGFILIPLSLLLIKYYPSEGRYYDPWTGQAELTGLTTNKNLLGVAVFTLLLGTLWRVIGILRSYENPPHRRRILWANGLLLLLGFSLLRVADSATSNLCFLLGAGLMIVTSTRFMRRNPRAVHVLILSLIAAIGVVMLAGVGEGMAHEIGRNSTLTGRTEIWADVIPLASNPLVGAGFESFWLNPSVHARLAELIPGLPLNEAHNGYIEVYLELGWVGLCLIAFILVAGYRLSVAAFRHNPRCGGLLIAYIAAATFYNLTEAGFRMMDPMWIFLLLAVMASGAIVSGVLAESSRGRRSPVKAVYWRQSQAAGSEAVTSA
jgi:exopolysaccharide production protein ExoQ